MNQKKILVVEDELEYSCALVKMYEEIIEENNADWLVLSAKTAEEAYKKIALGCEVLSVDFRLGRDNGLDVIERAADDPKSRTNGIILISGIGHDKKLDQAVPNQDDRLYLSANLVPEAEKHFPSKVKYVPKPREGRIGEQIEAISQFIDFETIKTLSTPFVFCDASETLTYKEKMYRLSEDAYGVIKEVHDKGGKIKNDEIDYLNKKFCDDASGKLGHLFDRGALDTPEFYKNFKDMGIIRRGGGYFHFQLPNP